MTREEMPPSGRLFLDELDTLENDEVVQEIKGYFRGKARPEGNRLYLPLRQIYPLI